MVIQKKVIPNLKSKNNEELSQSLKNLKIQLRNLRMAKISSGGGAKLARIKVIISKQIVRKKIAQHLTIMNQKARQTYREDLKKGSNRKLKPKWLREKLTRKFRRMLSKEQRKRVCTKIMKRKQNFPLLKYGIKA